MAGASSSASEVSGTAHRSCTNSAASRSVRPLHHSERNLRRVLPGMVHRGVRHHALSLVVVIAARVHIAVEAREVTARYLDTDTMPGGEVVTRGHRLQRHLVYLTRLHPHRRLVIPLAIAQPLDGLVQVVGGAVGIHVD